MKTANTAVDNSDFLSLWPIYLKLTVMSLLWAGTFITGRVIAEHLSPLESAVGRFSLALALLLLLTWKTEGKLPRLSLHQLAITFALGLTGVFTYNLCFFGALAEMPASRTALFVAFNPIVTVLLVTIFYKEKLSVLKLLGVTTAVCGAIIVISHGDIAAVFHDFGSTFGRGEMLMLSAVFSWAIYTVVGRQALIGLTPLVSITYAALWGLLLLLTVYLLSSDTSRLIDVNLPAAGAILYLALFGTVIPFIWFYQGVKTLGASRASVFTNFVPVFGVLLGVVLLNEELSYSMLVGGALVIVGVTLTNRRKA